MASRHRSLPGAAQSPGPPQPPVWRAPSPGPPAGPTRDQARMAFTAAIGDWCSGPGGLFEQLARAIERAIRRGDLAPGTRLPPERSAAAMLAVSRGTVMAAYAVLREPRLGIALLRPRGLHAGDTRRRGRPLHPAHTRPRGSRRREGA